jgi:ABC-type sugar transport system ATPase subunit
MAEPEVVLELRGITKRFPGVLANDRVDFDLRRGEIHALLGENGAGKSTLMNILYGLYTPDEGEIVVRGEAVRMSSPREAIERGIGMVHQHFMLIPVMTVAENIVLAVEPTRAGGLLDYRAASRTVSALAGSFGFAIDPNAAHRGHHRRPAAARRDPQSAVPEGGHPHSRRAHRPFSHRRSPPSCSESSAISSERGCRSSSSLTS